MLGMGLFRSRVVSENEQECDSAWGALGAAMAGFYILRGPGGQEEEEGN